MPSPARRKTKYVLVAAVVAALSAAGVTTANAADRSAQPPQPVLSKPAARLVLGGGGTTEFRSCTDRRTASFRAQANCPSPRIPRAANDPLAQQVLDQINQARAEQSLPPYALSAGLGAAARLHTVLMADGCGLSHRCPGEAGLSERITAQGVQWTAVGENVGYGGPVANTDAAIVGMARRLTTSMLTETPPDDGHRRNLLSSRFRNVGISLHRDLRGTVWMTQDFSN